MAPKRLEERGAANAAELRIAEEHAAHREFLLRTSLIASLRRARAID